MSKPILFVMAIIFIGLGYSLRTLQTSQPTTPIVLQKETDVLEKKNAAGLGSEKFEMAQNEKNRLMQPVLPVDFEKLMIASVDLLEKGRGFYTQECATCHGMTGKGNGPASSAFDPKPRDFTALNGWILGSKLSQIYQTLDQGILEKGMPSFEWMPIEDRFAISHYVRSFNADHPKENSAELTKFNLEYSFIKGKSIAEKIWDHYQCAECHQVRSMTQKPSEFYESVIEHEARYARKFQPETEPLQKREFYQNLTVNDLKQLVAYVMEEQGKE